MVLVESSTTYISLLWLVRASKAASVGAFVVQSLEFFNNIPEEIDYLWRTPFRLVTGLYAWSRYFPLCSQIVNLALSEIIYSNPKPKLCLFTFTVRAIGGQLLTTAVETILMIRVHALYNCSRRAGLFLSVIMISGTALEVTGSALSILDMVPGPTGTICNPKRNRIETMTIYIMGIGCTQGTLLIMTVSRVVFYRKIGWMRTPVVSLMLRDGVFVFLLVAMVIAGFAAVELLRSEDMPVLYNVAFSWYVALVSIVGCRVVLNMRKLAVQYPRNQRNTGITSSIQLSSLFEDQYISTPGDSTALSSL